MKTREKVCGCIPRENLLPKILALGRQIRSSTKAHGANGPWAIQFAISQVADFDTYRLMLRRYGHRRVDRWVGHVLRKGEGLI